MRTFRQILSFMRPFRRPLLFALLLTGGLTVVGMLPPLLMRRLINDVARQGQWGVFPLVMTLLFAVPVLRAIINIANSRTLNKVGLGVIGTTRKRMFRHMMRLSMRFYNDTPVGSINQRLMGDVANISTVATGGLITLLTDMIAVVFAVVVMLRLNVTLSGVTFALLPFYYLNYWFFSKRMQQATVQLRSQMDHVSSMLQERLSAHELIQAYGQEKEGATQFSSQAKQIMDTAIKGSAYSISFNQLSAFINKIGNSAIYCLGCYYFVKGSMGYGDVVAFCAYATQLLGPIVRFSTVANQIVQVGVSIDRVNEILNREPAIKETPNAGPVEELEGQVHLHGLSFAYEEGQPVLKDVDVEIPPGTHVALVGPAGSGRSTLAMLLRRFFEPAEGTIEVDAKDIRGYRLKDYRNALALILPESTIFDGSIRQNLLYGKLDASEKQMIEISEAVGLHDFVAELSQQYDTVLGTGGLKVSAGVQQLIGIARALISEPLILIVDEATASLDPETAQTVNESIRQIMKGRTCILILHRLLLARDLDHVVVMHDGKIVDAGTHDELILKPDSLYRTIYGMQYGQDQLPSPEEGKQ